MLEQTNLSLTDPQFSNLLANLQGHILKHHGRTHAYHIFLKFNPKKVALAKKWINKFANNEITSAATQLIDAANRNSGGNPDGGLFRNFSLSHSGYVNLGIPSANIPSSDVSFTKGLKASKDKLSDKFEDWEKPFLDTIDALIIVADENVSNASDDKNRILNEISGFSTVVHVQKGKILRNQHGIGIEHFGYADGISQPNFLANNDTPAVQWEDNGALLSTLLVPDPATTVADSFGSFYVFRKLEQNVEGFKEAEEEMSKGFNKESEEVFGIFDKNRVRNEELAGAMSVGRFEDGSDVINNSMEKDIVEPSQLFNDFDYRDDSAGLKCPFHAHIRVTNPRADVGQAFAKSVRLTRRGIPYNDIGRDEYDLDNDKPRGGVGLLFQCYQSSIQRQFEFIQSTWANHGDIGGHMVGQDAIIGQGVNTDPKLLQNQWGIGDVVQDMPASFGHFVTTKGGEYFFTPSLPFLRTI
jgi:Dyp-type peroxidase family